MNQLIINGKVKRGLRIASGLNQDPSLRLNNTIYYQKPFFEKACVPDIQSMYCGTVNVAIAPRKFKILKPDFEITCEWFLNTTETFHLVSVEIDRKGCSYSGYIYYPLPSVVKSHDDDTIELLASKIPDLEYGDLISIRIIDDKIILIEE